MTPSVLAIICVYCIVARKQFYYFHNFFFFLAIIFVAKFDLQIGMKSKMQD